MNNRYHLPSTTVKGNTSKETSQSQTRTPPLPTRKIPNSTPNKSMACIANTTRVIVPVNRPAVSTITHRHTTSPTIMNQHTLPSHMTFPVPASVFMTRKSSKQGLHSGVVNNEFSSMSKKRHRSEGSTKQRNEIPIAHEFLRTISSLPAKPLISVAPIAASQFKDSGESLGAAEIQLTKEQIDDVIDTTIPTNFSFSFPVKELSPKLPKDAMQSPTQKTKKQRRSRPPILEVVTKSPLPAAPAWKSIETSEPLSKVSSTSMLKKCASSGRWTQWEHEAFLEGLNIYGREWKKVALRISTRTSAQIRSHAQKYFAKLARDEVAHQAASSLSSYPDATTDTSGAAAVKRTDVAMENEYPPSVLHRVDKILKDPKGAEIEVADTLRRLRQRYDELHNKLEIKENQKIAADRSVASLEQAGHDVGTSSSTGPSLKTPTKFTFAAASSQNVVEGHEKDVPTMSRLSPIRSSLRLSDESLALHSRELIALTVLGGELYRSTSHQDLSRAKSSSTHTFGGEETVRKSSNPDLGALLKALTKASPTKSDADSN